MSGGARGVADTVSSARDLRGRFERAVLRNAYLDSLLDRVARSQLPGAYVSGGCVFQSIWNVEHGFEATHGILDYDVFYFDAADPSSDGERRAARSLASADLPVTVEVRNQARVHVWYEQTFGAPCRPFRRCEDGIDAFLATCCCFGVRRTTDGLTVYAPHGFADVFDMVVRPNPARVENGAALAGVCAAKTERWSHMWPRLCVLPWPAR
jgi:hypothetical protein